MNKICLHALKSSDIAAAASSADCCMAMSTKNVKEMVQKQKVVQKIRPNGLSVLCYNFSEN